MPPLNALNTWQYRSESKELKPKGRCFLVAEGANTELWYLDSLAAILAKRSLPRRIELKPVERSGNERGQSNPRKLLEQAELIRTDKDGKFGFEESTDSIVVIFDADIYKDDEQRYLEVVDEISKVARVAVTYPSFEVFLLLHVQDAVEEHLLTHEDEILKNGYVGKRNDEGGHRRYVEKLASDVLGMNVKKNPAVGKLAEKFDLAFANESKINQDSEKAIGRITSNVGHVLTSIINEGDS